MILLLLLLLSSGFCLHTAQAQEVGDVARCGLWEGAHPVTTHPLSGNYQGRRVCNRMWDVATRAVLGAFATGGFQA